MEHYVKETSRGKSITTPSSAQVSATPHPSTPIRTLQPARPSRTRPFGPKGVRSAGPAGCKASRGVRKRSLPGSRGRSPRPDPGDSAPPGSRGHPTRRAGDAVPAASRGTAPHGVQGTQSPPGSREGAPPGVQGTQSPRRPGAQPGMECWGRSPRQGCRRPIPSCAHGRSPAWAQGAEPRQTCRSRSPARVKGHSPARGAGDAVPARGANPARRAGDAAQRVPGAQPRRRSLAWDAGDALPAWVQGGAPGGVEGAEPLGWDG
ncbi:hypothetical protein QFZ76_006696 [Streptomyces sp. V4I2]|nr:hypothetical protein [Streptomyces sp. V4I2]